MAHQNKFVSVNLNKSYGRPSSSSSSSAFGHGRSRPGSGGGMVVLSRPRSSASSVSKPATRLAVPPPLNLPSLRKEHERFDPSSSAAAAGHGTSGLGSGAGSSAMGWSKPAVPPPSAEDAATVAATSQLGRSTGSSGRISSSAYTPPGSRPDMQRLHPAPAQVFTDKAVILRGEDFPSLRATAVALKQKENSSQKQKQKQSGEYQQERRTELTESRPPMEMRPQMRSSRLITGNAGDGDGGSNRRSDSELSQKDSGYLPSPLPLVRLQHTSDWADDERDTGLSLPERTRDGGFSRLQPAESREVYDGARDGERTSAPSGEFFKGDSFRREVNPVVNGGRDFGSWRSLPTRDRLSNRDFGVDKDRYDVRPSSANREVVQPPFGDNYHDGFSHGNQDSPHPRRDMGSHMNAQNIRAPAETFNGRTIDQNVRGRYADPSNNWYKGSPFQNNTIAKNYLSSANKRSSLIDPVMNFSKEKRSVPTTGKPYIEDIGFESNDPFLGGVGDVNLKVLKKKKDVLNQTYFHDPVRESFEAELDRILMAQEQERKRIMEEQARVLEQARKEEEERERLVREEEERRRLLEEEAREAAWRAEQEKLEAAKRVEEQRVAREEEKKMYQLEEERRKEAALRKLLELESRIARRQAEEKPKVDELPSASSADDEQVPSSAKQRDISQLRDWEDGERMMESINAFISSDNLSMDRNLDAGSRAQSSRHGNLPFMDLGKHSPYSSSLPVQDQVQHSPRRDAFSSRRGTFKKEPHGGLSAMSARPSSRGGKDESSDMFDEYRQSRQQRWNNATDGDHFRKNSDLDVDLVDNEKFEVGWHHGKPHGNPQASYGESSLQNYELDGFSSFTRYRQFLRQPRVPPPPSVTSMQRSSFGTPVDKEKNSFMGIKTHYHYSGRNEVHNSQSSYDGPYHDTHRAISVAPSLEENLHSEKIQGKISSRCDSMSSLSISSAPSSPTPLLHDEIYVTGDSPALPTSADGERTIFSDNEHVTTTIESGTLNRTSTSSEVSPGEDDEWGAGNHDHIHEQEYYDDDEDDYQEIDEVPESADDNLVLEQKLEDSPSDGQTANEEMEQVILGFDDGVEVQIPANRDFEMTSRNDDKEIVQQAGPPMMENLVTYGNNNTPEVKMDDSLSVIRDTEKAMQDLDLDPVTTSYPANTPELSQSSVIPPQHIPSLSPSLTQGPTSSTSSNISSSATVSQGEAPVKLQFGLFSGPSLIPSPVPAIQIGSIQMPIHVHNQITPSLPHVHPSQPPLFQFGLLRYPPPISQNMSSIPPCVPTPFSFNQNSADCVSNQASQDSCHSKAGDAEHSCSSDKRSGLSPNFGYEEVNVLPRTVASQNQTERCLIGEKKNTIDFVRHQNGGMPEKISHPPSPDQQHVELLNSHSLVGDAPTKVPGILSASRGKRYAYNGRNYGSRLTSSGVENVSSGLQRRVRRSTRRTEFRVRETVEKMQTSALRSLDYVEEDEKSNKNGRTSIVTMRKFGKKDVALNRSFRTTESNDLSLGSSSSRVTSYDAKMLKETRKDSASKIATPFDKSNTVKNNLNSEEDVEAPLQSGVVRVFKQPGIETPSDEDDFIEVRSKRQMLNDRREQREKENKSRTKISKMPRKQHNAPQSNVPISNSNKTAMSRDSDASNNVHPGSLVTVKKDSSKYDPSLAFTPNTSQVLSPIGIVNVNPEAMSTGLNSSTAVSFPVESTDTMKLSPSIMFENKVARGEDHTLPLNSWDSGSLNHQVMALTQTQLDEAMKPAQFDSPLAPSIILESKAISSIMTQENAFPSCSSPINSLLAGEKIQFGAVTSPTILPPVNRAISNGLGPPGSSRSEVTTNSTLVTTNNDCVMFFGKEKQHGKSFTNLEDHEAEAAASAVAVAAISNDEMVASGIGGSSSAATMDNKSFNNPDVTGFTSGGGMVSQVANGSSAGEESLTIALPADLSVDTSALSLWPPLPSPQASGSMLSHFPGAPPSHFPCFDMNSMLGGRIFTYGPNDESSGSQEQSQRSATLGSGPLGAWPQCHSGVDSFYGPPTGFAGPFISPGGIPGIQGPPHMVVYNHFAPVGHFGQLGLSFMGTTYIPAGNQPEQKQNQVCSAVSEGKGDSNTGNVSVQGTSPGMPVPIQHLGPGSSLMTTSGQGPTPSMPGPIQHLGPGSPLMPMASPLTMFDITPFQSTGIPMQAPWSHVPAPPLHSVPLSIPPQQHHESGMATQFNQSLPLDTSVVNNRFRDSRSSLPAGVSTGFSAPSSTASHLPHDLGLLEQPISTSGSTQIARPSYTAGSGNNTKTSRTATRTMVTNSGDNGSIGANNSISSSQNMGTASKSKRPSSSGQQYLNSVGHLDKQGGAAQKNALGGEWHRRAGFHGRNQGSGSDKTFGSSKVKQIYVAKPSTNVSSKQG